MPKIEFKDRIIFPLDFPDYDSAKKYVEILRGHIGLFKVGLELFVKEGPEILKLISGEGRAKIFLDLKFHDIPETVRGAMKSANALGAEFITVHCDEGRRLIEAAVETSGKTRVLGVTVLTSISREGLKEMGMREDLHDPLKLVLHRARIAKSAGCAGVVCSGLEAFYVRKEFGKDFIIVTPGIRPSWSIIKNDDQKRIVTPADAIKSGADYVVVGRPIRIAENPVDAVKKIEKEIEMALRDK